MPLVLRPPEDSDFPLLGLGGSNRLDDVVNGLPKPDRYYVVNTFERLYDVAWIASELDEDVGKQVGVVGAESILSLQMYLLLTCADVLGHIHLPKANGVRNRFYAFFENLSSATQQMLIEGLLVFEERLENLSQSRFANPTTDSLTQPDKRRQIELPVLSLSEKERLTAVVDFLYYARRNPYTHEAEFPQSGYHQNLHVLQMLRLDVPNVSTRGESDRIQIFVREKDGTLVLYYAYMAADDPILHLRQVIVSGLGEIIREKAGEP